jgi:hypothetical protein
MCCHPRTTSMTFAHAGADKMACCRRCLVLPFEASVATCTACNASSCTAAVCAKGYTGYNASTQKCTASIPVPTSASSCHTTARLLGGKCVCSSGYYWEHGSNSACVVRTDCGAFAQGQVVSSTQDTMCEFRMTTVSWMLVALLALPSCGYALFRRRRQRRQRLAVRQQSPARRFAPSRQVRSVATLRNVLRELGVTETLPPPHRRRPIPRDRVKLPPLKKAPGTAPIIYL